MAYGYLTTLGGFTIEGWILQNGQPSAFAAMYAQATQASATWQPLGSVRGRQVWFGIRPVNGGSLFLDVWDKSGINRVQWTDPTPTAITDNAWHHIALRLAADQKTFTIFVDGVVVATVASSVVIAWDAGSATVGGIWQPKFGAYGYDLWQGGLAYVSTKDTALTNNRIAEHYAAGNGGAVYYGDSEVSRINRVLDWAGVPAQSRQLDPPIVNMQGVQVTGANALDKTQEAAEAAGGYLFADGQTRIIYHNRRRRYNKASVFTFAESLGTAVEANVQYAIDDAWVYNDIRGDRPFGSTVRMIDQDSIDAYGRKVFKISLPITSHEDMRNAVGWLLSKYKQDRVRVDSVTIEVSTSDPMLPAGTGKLQIGDHIVLDELPEHAPDSTMEFIIEGIDIAADFSNSVWTTSFNLSPAEYEQVFEIGASALGSGDRIAF